MKIKEYTKAMEHLTGSEKPESIVYVLQELPGTRIGRPKYNIIGAQKYGKLKVLLKEDTQIIMSPGPIIYELRRLLKDYTSSDYLLLSGDPSVIGIACFIRYFHISFSFIFFIHLKYGAFKASIIYFSFLV